jgi:hypothetical protein
MSIPNDFRIFIFPNKVVETSWKLQLYIERLIEELLTCLQPLEPFYMASWYPLLLPPLLLARRGAPNEIGLIT